MSDKITPMWPSQLRLELEPDARTHFNERVRNDAIELLAMLLLSAAKAELLAEEERDENRESP